jgi:hypothetical protein
MAATETPSAAIGLFRAVTPKSAVSSQQSGFLIFWLTADR